MKSMLRFGALFAVACAALAGCAHQPAAPTPAPTQVKASPAPTPTGTPTVVTSTATNKVATILAKAKSDLAVFNAGVVTDAQSPAGQAMLADEMSATVNIMAAVAGDGLNAPADAASAYSLAGVLESYSQLPTTSPQLSGLAANAAGLDSRISQAAPAITQLVALGQSNGLPKTTVMQTIANGVYAFAGTKGQ